jgi:predicted DNA-binding transcriptional regulator AlpA
MDSDSIVYWNQAKVAAFFNVTPRSVYNWMRQGRLPAPVVLPNGWKAWDESTVRGLVKPSEDVAA